jgi:hypothetical protein
VAQHSTAQDAALQVGSRAIAQPAAQVARRHALCHVDPMYSILYTHRPSSTSPIQLGLKTDGKNSVPTRTVFYI